MKNKLFVGSGVMLLSILLACLLNVAAMWLVLKFVDVFVAVGFFGRIIISLVVSVVVISGLLGAVRYLVAYRSAEFDLSGFSISYLFASLIQLVIAFLLKFAPAVAGGTVYLAGIFEHGSQFSNVSDIEYIGILDYLPAFVILSVFIYVVNIACGYIGKNKRLKDREELLSNNS